jgi:hypothetical protein
MRKIISAHVYLALTKGVKGTLCTLIDYLARIVPLSLLKFLVEIYDASKAI